MTISEIVDEVELWQRLYDLVDDWLDQDMPEAEVDAALREAGFEPEEVRQRGAAFVEELRRQRADAKAGDA